MTNDVKKLLIDIDERRVAVKPSGETWKECYAGNCEFVTSNGWKIVVFNDCDSWDYIDSITAPDGRTWDYDYLYKHQDFHYYPKHEEDWGI